MRTKIIATIGPVSSSKEMLTKLAKAGVSIFRLNFSHGDVEFFRNVIQSIREIEKELGVTISVMQDLPGPKIRLGNIEGNHINVKAGDYLTLGSFATDNDEYLHLPFDNKYLMDTLQLGDILVLADGTLQLSVAKKLDDGRVIVESLGFGIITSRKGLALPGKTLALPALTEKDKEDLIIGLELGVDAVAMSFVQEAEDIRQIKAVLKQHNSKIPVVAKLERQSAVDNLDAILAETDMVMVARGDLGIECPLASLPAIQKRIINACNDLAKPVIVATQMLLSMVQNASPTRAEVTDVANAVLDGADCLMLSEETAMGDYPVGAVAYMRTIASNAEEFLVEQRELRRPEHGRGQAEFLAYSACLLAEKVDAFALAAHSKSGTSARLLAACRPRQSVYALTTDKNVVHNLNFSWGVLPFFVKDDPEVPHLIRVQRFISSRVECEKGNDVVITAGETSPGEDNRGTNLVKIFKK